MLSRPCGMYTRENLGSFLSLSDEDGSVNLNTSCDMRGTGTTQRQTGELYEAYEYKGFPTLIHRVFPGIHLYTVYTAYSTRHIHTARHMHTARHIHTARHRHATYTQLIAQLAPLSPPRRAPPSARTTAIVKT